MGIFDDIGKTIGGIFSGSVGDVINTVGNVFKAIKGEGPEDPKLTAAEMQINLELQKMQNEMQIKLTDAITSDLANQRDLMKAELNSEDPYVRRARPSIIWIGLIIFLINYALLPFITTLAQMLGGSFAFTPVILPDQFWYAWGLYTGGYAYLRTKEKQGEPLKLNIFGKKNG